MQLLRLSAGSMLRSKTCKLSKLLVLTMLKLPAGGAPAATDSGEVEEPCSLNGELKSGACVCDPGWSGAKCNALAVAPSHVLWPQLSDGDPRTHDASSLSWGGSVMQVRGLQVLVSITTG